MDLSRGRGLLRPWGPLAKVGQRDRTASGFLAYDLVLIVPFLKHFATVNAAHRPSLVVYTAVLVYSGVLAAYYLFVHASTHLRYSANP